MLDLPKSLTNELYGHSPMSESISKLRESLVVYGCIMAEGALCCGVWVMEHDLSFTMLFTIGANVDKILGFRKSGEPIFEAHKDYGEPTTTLDVYDPRSQQIKNLGIVERNGSFFIGSYKESLLLLDHSDLQIYVEHTVLTDQHRSLTEKVIDDEVNVKETSEALLKKLFDLEQEGASLNEKTTILDDENTKLKLEVPESESYVHESQSDSSQQDIEATENNSGVISERRKNLDLRFRFDCIETLGRMADNHPRKT
nr:hypothetical protein [Tanacetum cinerariifolium]